MKKIQPTPTKLDLGTFQRLFKISYAPAGNDGCCIQLGLDIRFEKYKYHDSLQAGDRGNWPLDKEIVNYKFDNHCQKFYILKEKSKRVYYLVTFI